MSFTAPKRASSRLVHTALCLLVTLLAPAGASAQMQRLFETTAPGALAITGNALGLSVNGTYTGPGTQGAIGAFITLNEDSHAGEAWPWGTTTSWLENGSMAHLDLPYEAEVLYALLVWGGSFDYPAGNVGPETLDTPISFETPAAVHSVSSTYGRTVSLEPVTGGRRFRVRFYTRAADVTTLVREAGAGYYGVSGVPATIAAAGQELNAAGWTLVVAYGDRSAVTRNMTLFFGGEWLDENAVLETTIEGFCAPPSGVVRGDVIVSALEGDAHFGGDRLAILRATGAREPVLLSGPFNPADNFFGSMINTLNGGPDPRATFGERNHNPVAGTSSVGGRQGWDITQVRLRSEDQHLSNGQRSATLRATNASGAVSDSTMITLLGLQIEVNAPRFRVDDAVLFEVIPATGSGTPWDPQTVVVGDEVDLVFELANSGAQGSAAAESIRWRVELPAGLSYVPGSFRRGSSPLDAEGRSVDASALRGGVAIGPLGMNESVLLSLRVRVDERPHSGDRFEARASWTYRWRSCADSAPLEATATSTTLGLAMSRLALVKEVEAARNPAEIGDEVTYRLSVTNVGAAPTRMALLEDSVPEGLAYVADSTTLQGAPVPDRAGLMPFTGGAPIHVSPAQPGRIPPGEQVVVTFRARVTPSAPPLVRNQARVFDGAIEGGEAIASRNLRTDTGSGEQDVWVDDDAEDALPEDLREVDDAGVDVAQDLANPEEPPEVGSSDDALAEDDATGSLPTRPGRDVDEGERVSSTSRETGCCSVIGGGSPSTAGWLALGVMALLWRGRRSRGGKATTAP